MPEALTYWAMFIAIAAVIAVAGPYVSRNGDIIAEKTNLSGGWIGLVLIATVTSMPELVTGVSAVTYWDLPDIAAGDALGSCVFNLAILIVVDFMLRGEPVYSRANRGHIISGGFGIVLIGFVALTILIEQNGGGLRLGHIGISTPIMLLLYAGAMRTVFVYERDHREQFSEDVARRHPDVTLGMAARRYAAAAAAIAVAGVALPFAGSAIADIMGWNRTFVGTLLIAGATSLPELVVTIAAVRYGALNMAVAGLLGSNLFNMLILAIEDELYLPGPLLAHVSPAHAVSAISAMIMTGIAIIGLQFGPRSRIFGTVGWASLAIFTVYLFNSYVLYLHGH